MTRESHVSDDARSVADCTRLPRVAVVNLGCRVNRVEADLIASRLVELGCQIVHETEADAVVINTCAVTGEAQAKARKAVRHARDLPKAPVVVACGCAANLFAEELCTAAPGTVIERRKDRVADLVMDLLGFDTSSTMPQGHVPTCTAITPTGRMRPGIKIQDGCDNRCTYCIVWKARGPSVSLASDEVVAAVDAACARGAHEVVLTGINLGSYRTSRGDTLGEGSTLDALLRRLLDETSVERLRLSSIEPPDVTDKLLDVMATSAGRIAPFLHVCLQSGCDATLERMGRLYNTAEFADVVNRARAHVPGIALETDVIAGFPGETAAEYQSSRDFCHAMGFSRMHVFRYSRRPGTPAATMAQVESTIVSERASELRALGRSMRLDFARSLDGLKDNLLVIEPGRSVGAHLFDIQVDSSLEPGTYLQATIKLDSNLTLSVD